MIAFKNLQLYRLPAPWGVSLDEIREQLARKPLQPCCSQDRESRGWLPPAAGPDLVHAVGDQWLIALGVETKLLPATVVRQAADKRAEEVAEKQGYKLGRKQMKDLREQLEQELLPRALPLRHKVFAWIDPIAGWLVINATSPARGEEMVEMLRQTLDTFPVKLLRTELSSAGAMADWLAAEEAPAGFTIDRDCELLSVTEDKSTVRYQRHTLEGEEVKGHLAAGKLPTKLALTFNDRISFVLTHRLELKRIDFLDVVTEQLTNSAEDAEALFNAEFALMTGELKQLLQALVQALGGELAEVGK